MLINSGALLLLLCVLHVNSLSFLGGTISWSVQEPSNAVRFVYRLTWEKGFGLCGPSCSSAQIGNLTDGSNVPGVIPSLEWRYNDGNSTTSLSDVSYYLTSVSEIIQPGWEQGENTFTFSGFQINIPYSVFLDSIPWINGGNQTNMSLGYMETSVDLRRRSDTGKINSSPYVSPQPIIGVEFGCSTMVTIPAEDPDSDIVRCRLANPDECGQACTNTPVNALKLSKANCIINVHAYNETGFQEDGIYRLTLVTEDFPHGIIKVGRDTFSRRTALSRVPLQLTLKVSAANQGCTQGGLSFVGEPGTSLINFERFTVGKSTVTTIKYLYIQTADINSTDFMTSIPQYVTALRLQDSNNRANVTELALVWTPKSSQSGYQQSCAWGIRSDGITSDVFCYTNLVLDTNNCSPALCRNNGTCVDIFNETNEICDCPTGYKPPYCINETTCLDEPCANNASCSLPASKYSCSCVEGYSGVECEEVIDHCLSSPCKNDGTCLDLQNDYLCLCPDKYKGTNCEIGGRETSKSNKKSGDTEGKDNVLIPVLISLFATLIGLAILFICVYIHKKDKIIQLLKNHNFMKNSVAQQPSS